MSTPRQTQKTKLLLRIIEITGGNWYLDDCLNAVEVIEKFEQETTKSKLTTIKTEEKK